MKKISAWVGRWKCAELTGKTYFNVCNWPFVYIGKYVDQIAPDTNLVFSLFVSTLEDFPFGSAEIIPVMLCIQK